MAAAAAARSALDGRYPRWGYLDKFDVNEYIARAFVVALILHAGLLTIYVAYQAHSRDPVLVLRALPDRPRAYAVHPRPQVVLIAPPRLAGASKVVPAAVRDRIPVPVPDDEAEVETLDTQNGWSGGSRAGERGLSTNGPAVDVRPASLPRADEFIAVEVQPKLLRMQAPLYPELARDAGVEGRLLIRVLVGADGFVRDAIVIDGVPMLDAAALTAARTAVFKPALQGGEPVAVWIVIPMEFSLYD